MRSSSQLDDGLYSSTAMHTCRHLAVCHAITMLTCMSPVRWQMHPQRNRPHWRDTSHVITASSIVPSRPPALPSPPFPCSPSLLPSPALWPSAAPSLQAHREGEGQTDEEQQRHDGGRMEYTNMHCVQCPQCADEMLPPSAWLRACAACHSNAKDSMEDAGGRIDACNRLHWRQMQRDWRH